jgi:uracil-DNA glycosylase
MNNIPHEYYRMLGLTEWKLRKVTPENMDWQTLKATVSVCTLCGLEKSRTQTVFGAGNPHADLMFIGEAPGANEDKQGEPFVGRAGKLLNLMLNAIDISREQIFITNIIKCRPPNNRDPLTHEVAACSPYLQQQIALIKPKLVVVLGRIAAHYLLDTKTALGSLRSKLHYYGQYQTPLIVTYHPAYLLRNPADKKKSFIDLQFIAQQLAIINGRHPKTAGT